MRYCRRSLACVPLRSLRYHWVSVACIRLRFVLYVTLLLTLRALYPLVRVTHNALLFVRHLFACKDVLMRSYFYVQEQEEALGSC